MTKALAVFAITHLAAAAVGYHIAPKLILDCQNSRTIA